MGIIHEVAARVQKQRIAKNRERHKHTVSMTVCCGHQRDKSPVPVRLGLKKT